MSRSDRKVFGFSYRERMQIAAALRFWGRAAETGLVHPSEHPRIKLRFKKCTPMSLDELESLIGKIDGTWPFRHLLAWDPEKHL
jgi:hypothetical protein